MKEFINHKVLVTTQGWFFAPDGLEYRGVYGTLKAVHEAGKELGFIPNRSHANWFIEIGNMIIMGCQVMYIVRADEAATGSVKAWDYHDGAIKEYDRPTKIYNSGL